MCHEHHLTFPSSTVKPSVPNSSDSGPPSHSDPDLYRTFASKTPLFSGVNSCWTTSSPPCLWVKCHQPLFSPMFNPSFWMSSHPQTSFLDQVKLIKSNQPFIIINLDLNSKTLIVTSSFSILVVRSHPNPAKPGTTGHGTGAPPSAPRSDARRGAGPRRPCLPQPAEKPKRRKTGDILGDTLEPMLEYARIWWSHTKPSSFLFFWTCWSTPVVFKQEDGGIKPADGEVEQPRETQNLKDA